LQIQRQRQNPGALLQEIKYTESYREYFWQSIGETGMPDRCAADLAKLNFKKGEIPCRPT
jgi:hypothetical protein